MERVLSGSFAAPLSGKERALLEFVDKVNSAAPEMRREDVEAARRAGWSEEALYDAMTVCGLFNFYNRWCDAAGVQDLPEDYYRLSAKRMATHGYSLEL